MAKCPNKNTPEWEELVAEYGEDLAYFYWDITQDPERIADGVDKVKEKAVDDQLEKLSQRYMALEKISAMENRKEVETRKALVRAAMNRLSNERTYEKLLEISMYQISQLKKTLYPTKGIDEITAFELNDAIKVIKNLRGLTEILAGSPNLKVKQGVAAINSWATALNLRQKELTKELALQLAKKYNVPTEKIFDAIRDELQLSTKTLGLQTSQVPLAQLISRVIQNITRQSNELLENQFDNKLRDLLKASGKKSFEASDFKRITYDNGNFITPFTESYFSERKILWETHRKLLNKYMEDTDNEKAKNAVKASFQTIFKWYVDSHDYYLTEEGINEFLKDKEDNVEAFTDINGVLTAEGEEANSEFIARFSPYLVGKPDPNTGLMSIEAKNVPVIKMANGDYVANTNWYRYLVAKPKAKYQNQDFQRVSNDPLYKFVVDRYLEALRMMPHETALDVGNFYKFLEEINLNTVSSEFSLRTLGAGLMDIAKNTYTISTNLAEIEGGIVETVVNPVTGKVTEKVTPLFKIKDEKGRPIPHLNPKTLEDIKEVSKPKNPIELLREFYKTAVTYQHQVHALSVMELLEHKLEDIPAINTHPIGSILRTAQNRPSETEAGLTNVLSQTRYAIYTAVSGKSKLDASSMAIITSSTKEQLKKETEEWLKNGRKGPIPTAKVFSGVKTLDTIVDYTRMTLIGLKPFTAASNLFIGLLNNYTYAARQAEFKDVHLDQAFRMLAGNMFKFYRVTKKFNNKDFEQVEKISNLSEKFGITTSMYENADPNVYRRAQNKVVKFLYALQEGGEFLIGNQIMLALMLNTEIQDKYGKKTNLFEAFDRNGQLKPEFSHLEEWKSVEVMKDGENVSKLNQFMTTLTSIRHRTQGDYSNPIEIQKGIAGRIVMMFRKWLPQAIRERWGSENEMLNFKGRYRTYIDLISKNKKKSNLQFFGKLITTTLANVTNILPLGKYRINKLSNWANDEYTKYLESIGASKLDIENMRANIKELDLMVTMTILTLAFTALKKSDDGDDDDLMTVNFLINLLNRSQKDLTFFMWPPSAMAIIKDPIPLYKTVQEAGDILNAARDYIFTSKPTRFQKGVNEGELKLWKEIKDLLPVFSAMESTQSTVSRVFDQDAYRYTDKR